VGAPHRIGGGNVAVITIQNSGDIHYCCPMFALGSSYWGIWSAVDFPYIQYTENNEYEFSLIPYSENVRRPGFLKECYFLGVQE
jgi:hypothetical protein